MSEHHVVDDLLAYVSGELDRAVVSMVEDHLASCDACRREYDSLRIFWEELGKSPDEVPERSLDLGFRDMLTSYQREERQRGSSRLRIRGESFPDRILHGRLALQLGFAAGLLVVGLVFGFALGSRTAGNGDLVQLREEVHHLRNLVAVSLLQQESASERLKGVSWSSKLAQRDPDIRSALLNTMKYDHNVNVRLAALEAISRDINSQSVRNEIIRALPAEKSPLMQLALADVLVRINDAEAREALRQALSRPDLHPDVRKRIRQGIQLIL